MGDGEGGHWLVRMEWHPAGWSVLSASVNLPLHHKVQKFSSGTGSPRWSQKKGRKMVVVVVVLSCLCYGQAGISTVCMLIVHTSVKLSSMT